MILKNRKPLQYPNIFLFFSIIFLSQGLISANDAHERVRKQDHSVTKKRKKILTATILSLFGSFILYLAFRTPKDKKSTQGHRLGKSEDNQGVRKNLITLKDKNDSNPNDHKQKKEKKKVILFDEKLKKNINNLKLNTSYKKNVFRKKAMPKNFEDLWKHWNHLSTIHS